MWPVAAQAAQAGQTVQITFPAEVASNRTRREACHAPIRKGHMVETKVGNGGENNPEIRGIDSGVAAVCLELTTQLAGGQYNITPHPPPPPPLPPIPPTPTRKRKHLDVSLTELYIENIHHKTDLKIQSIVQEYSARLRSAARVRKPTGEPDHKIRKEDI